MKKVYEVVRQSNGLALKHLFPGQELSYLVPAFARMSGIQSVRAGTKGTVEFNSGTEGADIVIKSVAPSGSFMRAEYSRGTSAVLSKEYVQHMLLSVGVPCGVTFKLDGYTVVDGRFIEIPKPKGPLPVSTCSFIKASDLVPKDWSDWFYNWIDDSTPCEWGDKNKTLVTAASLLKHCKDQLNYLPPCKPDAVPLGAVDEFLGLLRSLGDMYVDLEN